MNIEKIKLPFKIRKPVLALGSQLKNRLCFAKGRYAYFSRLHSDLSDPEEFANFYKDVKYFLKERPKIIAVDLHPRYQSTQYAQNLQAEGYRLEAVQHHHAHIASCMAENLLSKRKVIGVAFDGTGLGSDNTLWGGEFLIAGYTDFKRLAWLRPVTLVGSEQAIKQPWRVAAIWLYLAYKDRFLNLNIPFAKILDKNKWRILKEMYLKNINSSLSSSIGRLFDSAASIILNKYNADFEAQLAIELQKLAERYCGHKIKPFAFKIIDKGGSYIIDPLSVFKGIAGDLKRKKDPAQIALRFHSTIAEMIGRICLILREKHRLNTVVLSGGVFQNSLLQELTLDLLYRQGFTVYTQQKLSSSDASLSLGQTIAAIFRS